MNAKPDLNLALTHTALVTGDKDTPVHLRFISDADKSRPTIKRVGTVANLWSESCEFQRQRYGAFLVVNEGGDTDADITRVRACFVDADGISLPDTWHLTPDFLVQRDATHWHAYWRVYDCPVESFRECQRRLAAYYGTDPAVCNPSRVMRLAGTVWIF